MGILGIILAIVGLGILIIGVFALVGAGTTASALGLGDAATTVLSGIGSFIASWWQLFAVILIIGLIAYVARRGTGSGDLGFERAAGAAEGITKGLTSEDDSSSSTSSSSDPSSSSSSSTPSSSSGSSSSGNSGGQQQQQQQQMMNQMMQAMVAGNMNQQSPGGPYVFPNNNINQNMLGGGGISPWIYRTFMMNAQNFDGGNLMQQLNQFMVQNNYGQITDEILVEFMEKVLDIDIGDSEGDNIIVQINSEIQAEKIEYFEQNVLQITSSLNLNNNDEKLIQQLIELLNSVEKEEFEISGNIIIINAKDFDVELKLGVVLRLIDLINQISQKEAVINLFLQKITEIQVNQINEEVIEQILILLQQSIQQTKGGSTSDNIPYGDERTARGDSASTNSRIPIGDERTARGDSSPNDEYISDQPKGDNMSDFSRQLIQDLKDQINHLEKEEELEMEGLQEQRDAEQKLAEALNGLNEERSVLEAIMYFSQVNLSQPQGQVHQKVEKFIQQSNKIGSVGQLLSEVDQVEQFIKEIEVAEQEIRDAEEKLQQAVKDEEAVDRDAKEVFELINQIQNGASKFREWGKGEQ